MEERNMDYQGEKENEQILGRVDKVVKEKETKKL